MNSRLVPDMADLSVLLGVCLVAVLFIGLGVLAGARRVETALVAGWGVAGFATVAIGTQTRIGLSWVMAILALGGLAGLARAGFAAARGSMPLRSGMAAKVGLLAVPFVLCVASVRTIGWDDFSHWLPNLAYVSHYDHFPSLAQPNVSDHAGYPYALALPGFAIFLVLGRVADDAAPFWNLVVMLAAGSSIATVLGSRLITGDQDPRRVRAKAWFSAAIGFLTAGLACPSFVPKIFFSNMADYASGAVLTVIGLMLFDWAGAAGGRGERFRAAGVIACGCVALIDLRQANAALFGLLVLSCCLAAWWHRDRPESGVLVSLAIVVLPPALILLLWTRYVAAEIPGGELPILPFSQWRWALFPTALHSMLRIMIAKSGLFLLILAIAIRAALASRANDGLDRRERQVLLTSATICVGAIGFLAATYLVVGFELQESAAAASFWRYMGELGPLAVLGAVAGIPLAWLRRVPWRPAMLTLVAVAVLLPQATLTFYRPDLTSAVPTLRLEAAAVDRLVPRTAPLRLVDLTGNGFAVLVMYYQLVLSGGDRDQPPRVVTRLSNANGISAEQAKTIDFADSPYIWLAEGAPEMSAMFGPRLSAGCSYLLRRDVDTFAVAAKWPIGRYKWGSAGAIGWSPAAEAACR